MINATDDSHQKKIIVYFDGVCGLCNRFVDFLITQDHYDSLRFSPLQSNRAQSTLPAEYVNSDDMQSVVVEKNGELFFRSHAVIVALSELGGVYKLLLLGRLFPQSFTDKIYNFIARRRYAWFGKAESCRLPTAEEKSKFL